MECESIDSAFSGNALTCNWKQDETMDATKTKPFNIDKKLVYDAYKAVKANAGAAGVDGCRSASPSGGGRCAIMAVMSLSILATACKASFHRRSSSLATSRLAGSTAS